MAEPTQTAGPSRDDLLEFLWDYPIDCGMLLTVTGTRFEITSFAPHQQHRAAMAEMVRQIQKLVAAEETAVIAASQLQPGEN